MDLGFSFHRLSPNSDLDRGRRHYAGALVLLLLAALLSTAQAWELRVCAEPNNMPFSNRAEEGFENRIAQVVAQELGATLSYEWLPSSRVSDRLLHLRRGDCDLAIGVGDGSEGYMTTVAYYRSAPVFVYREDAPFEVGSFDDEILHDLRIAVLAGAGVRPEVAALANRELMGNVVSYSWAAPGPTPLAAPVEAVAAGEVDIAVLWGPVGSYFAERQQVPLEVVSAEPKLDLPFLNLVVPVSMGVRTGDEALRDLLSGAIASGWEEIQQILDDYSVPLEPLPRPELATTGGEPEIRLGFALPLPTGGIPLEADALHAAAKAAQMGAIMAQEELGAASDSIGSLEILFGNTPGAASARRAAERMIANGAVAVVGGFGLEQAEELSRIAAAQEVPFLNIGSANQELRSECSDFVFHLEASDEMYLSALASALGESGLQSWFIAYPDSEAGMRLVESMERVASGSGAEVVGAAALADEQQLIEVVLASREAEADVIVALLDWRAQLDLAGFVGSLGEGIVLSGFPYPVSQTRSFYFSLQSLITGETETPRVALWEASLDGPEASRLNQAFFARWGEQMEPSAWAAYVAVAAVLRALEERGAGAEGDLASVLEGLEFELFKGVAGTFAENHQMRQPIYSVRLDPSANSRPEFIRVGREFTPEVAQASSCN